MCVCVCERERERERAVISFSPGMVQLTRQLQLLLSNLLPHPSKVMMSFIDTNRVFINGFLLICSDDAKCQKIAA